MKIGILTFHCAHNYGAVLQAYALQEKLKVMGHDVEIIDYRPNYLVTPFVAFTIRNNQSRKPTYLIRRFIDSVLTFYTKTRRRKVFKRFMHNRYHLSNPVKDKIPNDYDLYILGSDQIWNFRLTRGFDKVYYGFFDTKKGAKKITYAASFGQSVIGDNEKTALKEALNNFDGISLREKEYTPLLQSLTDKKIEDVLDPTLIADTVIWDEFAVRPKINEKYVLIYQVKIDKQLREIAKHIASQIGATVIEIPSWVTTANLLNKQNATSPEEYVGWIKYASCIITSSFHGTAFSILFNRPFYSVSLNDGLEKRPKNLLQNLGLIDRLIEKDEYPNFEEVDFEEANEKLEVLKQNSIDYLNQFLRL